MGAAQFGRRSTIARTENRIESAKALKSALVRHLNHRNGGLGEHSLRPLEAKRLGQVARRHTELTLHGTPHMAFARAKVCGECAHAPAIEGAVGDPFGGGASEARDGVHWRAARRKLRPAAQARAEPRPFGGRRRQEEAPALGPRRPRWTHRTAVDARRGDADDAPSKVLYRTHGELKHIQYVIDFEGSPQCEESLIRICYDTDADGEATTIYVVEVNEELETVGSYMIAELVASKVVPLQAKPLDLPAPEVKVIKKTTQEEKENQEKSKKVDGKNVG